MSDTLDLCGSDFQCLAVQVVAPDIHTSPLSPGGPRACYPLRGARALRPASPRRPFRLPHGTPGSALFQQASTHAHETLLWASKGSKSRHTFNYDLINSRDQNAQVSSVWHIPSVPKREKLHGYHPTQKPLRLVRRAILASSREGELVFDPFCGSGTSGVASKELGRFFIGAEKEEEYAELAGRRIGAAERGGVLRELLTPTSARTPPQP
jgi:hypothetical protein